MKTSELKEHALDWAVTTIEEPNELYSDDYGLKLWRYRRNNETIDGFFMYRYSAVWVQGGEIIERECISIEHKTDTGVWVATRIEGSAVSEEYGDTPLIAAMRCYVASKLGDEVEIPAELTQGEAK